MTEKLEERMFGVPIIIKTERDMGHTHYHPDALTVIKSIGVVYFKKIEQMHENYLKGHKDARSVTTTIRTTVVRR